MTSHDLKIEDCCDISVHGGTLGKVHMIMICPPIKCILILMHPLLHKISIMWSCMDWMI